MGMVMPIPTLPVVVSTKRFEVPTSRFELTKRLSPVFAMMFEVVRVPTDAVPERTMSGPRNVVPVLTSPPAVIEPDTVRFGL